MKLFQHSLIPLILFSCVKLSAVAPLILPRSQSEDAPRDLVGMTRIINQYDREQVYGAWAITPEYTRSFRPNVLNEALFGTDIIKASPQYIQISGSQVGDRNATDWLADYFGLPPDFQSKLSFTPRMENVMVDFAFYLGLDQWLDGLYFRCHAPVCYTRWSLGFTETDIVPGVTGYNAGYFTPTAIPRASLLANFGAYASGQVLSLPNNVFVDPLKKAQISSKRHSLTRLSDFQAAFGWNFLQGDEHHVGLMLRMAAPCGNRPDGEYLFEPIVGNGHHWELGLGFTSHVLIFVDECRSRYIGFYCDANLTTLFSAKQTRTFDLMNKPLSRYLLLERMGTPVSNLFISTAQGSTAGAVAPSAQFQSLYTPLANISTFDVRVAIAAQFDFVAMLDIQWGNWNADFGYNYWGRTCEKIKPECQCSIPFDGNVNFALKGDAYTFGFVAADAVGLPAGIVAGQAIPLSATESMADIHAGTNTPIGTPYSPTQNQNVGIDGAPNVYAFVSLNGPSDQIVVAPGDSGGAATQQRSSLTPVLINYKMIDLEGAETKGGSNKLFGHISYTWNDRCDCAWTPSVGFGGFAELAHNNEGECHEQAEDRSCQSVVFSQWGVWLKAAFAF